MKDLESQNKRISAPLVYLMGMVFLIFSFMVVGSVATHKMVTIFNHHPALGKPLVGSLYAPYQFLVWYLQYNVPVGQGLRPKLDLVIICVLIAEGLLFLVTVFTIGLITKSSRKNKDIHGSARWADFDELPDMGLLPQKGKKGEGVYVGAIRDKQGRLHYLRHNGPEHVIGIAPTRSGKGVGLVVPTTLSWPHSMLISDMKGELWAMTSGWRSQYANNICIKFDPAAEHGSASFNSLAEIRLGTPYEVSDTQNLVTILVDPEGKGLNDHWSKTGSALLVGVILYTLYRVREETGGIASLGEVAMTISDPSQPIDELWNAMLFNQYGENGAAHINIASPARDMQNTPEEERGSIISTARSFLTLYRDPIVEKNTKYSDFTVSDLMDADKPVSLYLVVRPGDKDRLKPLIRLMLTQILRVLIREEMKIGADGAAKAAHKHRLLMMLDEFPGFGRLKVFEDALPYIAGYGIKAYLIAQDIEQLRASDAYGREETISANCHVRIAYAPNKLETAEWLSKMSGQKTQHSEEISTSGNRFGAVMGNVNRTFHSFARPLLTPDECLRLKAPKKSPDGLKIVESGDLLVFVAGNNPVYGEQSLFFIDPTFQKRVKVPALKESQIIRPRAGTHQTAHDAVDEFVMGEGA